MILFSLFNKFVAGLMIVKMLSAPEIPLPPDMVPFNSGYAAHYGVGVMERVSQYRGMPIVDCMIVERTSSLDQWYYVEAVKTGHYELCRTTDVVQDRHQELHIRQNVQIEFGWESAKRFCNLDYPAQEPPRECPVNVYTQEEFVRAQQEQLHNVIAQHISEGHSNRFFITSDSGANNAFSVSDSAFDSVAGKLASRGDM